MARPRGRRETYQERRERRAAIDDPQVVLDAAARYLEVRSRSIEEIRRHLAGAGYRTDLVEAAVARLTELGMLDDAAFATSWVESRDRARPRGERALRMELARKGIDSATIGRVLGARGAEPQGDGDAPPGDGADGPLDGRPGRVADEAAAERLLGKRIATLARVGDPRARRQRAYALLARNGFDPDTCRTVSLRVLAQLEAAQDGVRDLEDDADPAE